MINYGRALSILLLIACILGSSASWAMTKEQFLQSLNEVENFTHYSARPIQTASREEAFDALKDHLWAMGEHHQHMAAMYKKRINISSKLKDQRKYLNDFLSQTVGFNLPQTISPKEFINNLINAHDYCAGIWLKKHSGLTGEVFIINGEMGTSSEILHPSLENSRKIAQAFMGSFKSFSPQLEAAKHNPEKYINNKAALGFFDESWALRYAHALILPWTRSDEDIQKEKAAVEKREKIRLKRQRQKANKKAAQVIETELIETEPSSRPIKILPLLEEVNQEENKINAVVISLGVEEPLIKETAIIQTEEKADQSIENFDYGLFVEEERQKSFEKKQMKEEESIPVLFQKELASPALPRFQVDKESYYTFMNLFNGQNIAFKAFAKAFKNGLKGNMYKNKGGSIRTFQVGNRSFNLHKPHGKKGKAMFYDDLRQYAAFKLAEFGITEATLLLKE